MLAAMARMKTTWNEAACSSQPTTQVNSTAIAPTATHEPVLITHTRTPNPSPVAQNATNTPAPSNGQAYDFSDDRAEKWDSGRHVQPSIAAQRHRGLATNRLRAIDRPNSRPFVLAASHPCLTDHPRPAMAVPSCKWKRQKPLRSMRGLLRARLYEGPSPRTRRVRRGQALRKPLCRSELRLKSRTVTPPPANGGSPSTKCPRENAPVEPPGRCPATAPEARSPTSLFRVYPRPAFLP